MGRVRPLSASRRFSESDVRQIRALGRLRLELERQLAEVSCRAVAARYGTTKQTIHRIQTGESYPWVRDEEAGKP